MQYRYGQEPQYWAKKWKDINQRSLERGSIIHLNMEALAEYNQPVDKMLELFQHTRILPIDERRLPERIDYSSYRDGSYPELTFWNHKWGIAGRVDLSVFQTLQFHFHHHRQPTYHSAKVLSICDYKTNRRIRKYSFQARDGSYQMMKWPLNHIMDSNYWHYVLQMSLYQFLGEYHGLLPGIRTLIHFPHEIEGLGTPSPVTYEIPYLRREVIRMIGAYRGRIQPPNLLPCR